MSSRLLESTDAAPEEPYPRPTRPDTATRERRRCPRVRPRVFFFLADSRRRYSDSARFSLNRADSGRIRRNGRFKPWQRRNRHGRGGGCCFSFLFFFFRHGRGGSCFFFVLSACSSSSPFFVLSVLFSSILNFPCLVLCFVNLAREWMLEMIKRFDKTLFLRATRNI